MRDQLRTKNGFYAVRAICYVVAAVNLLSGFALAMFVFTAATDLFTAVATIVASGIVAILWYVGGRVAGAMGDLCVDTAAVRAGINKLIDLSRPAQSNLPADPYRGAPWPQPAPPVPMDDIDDDRSTDEIEAKFRESESSSNKPEPTPRRRFRVRGPKKDGGKVVTALVEAETEIVARRKALRHLSEIQSVELEPAPESVFDV